MYRGSACGDPCVPLRVELCLVSSCIISHTSHVTRHTSHITRHTSHCLLSSCAHDRAVKEKDCTDVAHVNCGQQHVVLAAAA